MSEHLRKRSFRLAGHRTSVALEVEFWTVIEGIARDRGVALAALVAEVDAGRADPEVPLASALRVFALREALGGRAPSPALPRRAEGTPSA